MFTFKKAQAGFTLIEVVAAAALLGLMVTMAMPSLSAANAKVKNSRLRADLATVDQAIQLYVIDKGTLPTNLQALMPNYLSGSELPKDATNTDLEYQSSDGTYTLTGKDTTNNTVTSTGSTASSAGNGGTGGTDNTQG